MSGQPLRVRGGVRVLQPTTADWLAPFLLAPVTALACLALLLGQWVATADGRATPPDPEVLTIAVLPVEGGTEIGDIADGEQAATTALGAAMAERLAAVPGVAAAMPVDPARVAALTAIVFDGIPGVAAGAPLPILIDVTVSPAAATERQELLDRVAAAVPGALALSPPDATPAVAARQGRGIGVFIGTVVSVSAVLALSAVAMAVVTRRSMSDNAGDIELLRQLGADPAMVSALHRDVAVRIGWVAGFLGFGIATAMALAGALSIGFEREVVLSRIMAPPWLPVLALLVPPATALACRFGAAVSTRRMAMRGLDE